MVFKRILEASFTHGALGFGEQEWSASFRKPAERFFLLFGEQVQIASQKGLNMFFSLFLKDLGGLKSSYGFQVRV